MNLELIDHTYQNQVTVYVACLAWTQVKHLFPNGLILNDIGIVETSDLSFQLDETQQIFAIPYGFKTPEYFPQFQKVHVASDTQTKKLIPLEFLTDSYHRQLVEKFTTDVAVVKPPALTEFNFPKRWDSALAEWNNLNNLKF